MLLSLRHYWALGYPMDQVPNAFSLLQSPFFIFFLILLFFRLFQVTSANYLNLLLPVPCSAFCVEFSLCSLFWMRSDDFFYPGLWLPCLITPKHTFLFEEIWIYLYVPHIFLYIPIQLHRWMHAMCMHKCVHTQPFILSGFLCHLFLEVGCFCSTRHV